MRKLQKQPGKAPAARTCQMTVPAMALLTSAAVVTSLRGLPTMALEELTMLVYIGFATGLFLIPASLVSAELGGMFADRKGGVYVWIGEAFGKRWGFLAVWLQWIQNVVWYPTGLGFAAAAAAFVFNDRSLANNNTFFGLFCIAAYWLATLVALSGTDLMVKVTKYGFLAGTIIPGLLLIGLFLYWVISANPIGWEQATDPAVATVTDGHHHPRWFPHIDGLGTMAFLASILLLFAGVEVQAVHVTEMRNPRRGYPAAMLLAAAIAFGIFTAGALAIAGILPYNDISLQSGVFDAFSKILDDQLGIAWVLPIISALICCGALAWIAGPSRALLATAHDGLLPPFMQRTNRRGIQRNILVVQGLIVTAISSIYLIMSDVSAAFFLISAMTISLYLVMYLLLYAAAIRLKRTRPDLPRSFQIPGGPTGMRLVAGVGFAAVAFAFVLSFVPPSQLTVGSPALYTSLVAAGAIVFTAAPLIITRLSKPTYHRRSAQLATRLLSANRCDAESPRPPQPPSWIRWLIRCRATGWSRRAPAPSAGLVGAGRPPTPPAGWHARRDQAASALGNVSQR